MQRVHVWVVLQVQIVDRWLIYIIVIELVVYLMLGGIVGYTGDVSNSYYNHTIFEFYTPTSGVKPTFAFGNNINSDEVRGVAKEVLFKTEAFFLNMGF